MKFWKFSVGGCGIAIVEGKQQLYQGKESIFFDADLGLGVKMLVGVVELENKTFVWCCGKDGTAGFSLITALLCAGQYLMVTKGQTQGVLWANQRCFTYCNQTKGMSVMLPIITQLEETMDYYGLHQCRQTGIITSQIPTDISQHVIRKVDNQSFYLDSSLIEMGKVACSFEGCACGFFQLMGHNQIQSQAMALTTGGRCYLRLEGKNLCLTSKIFFLCEGRMFEKENEVRYN